MDLQALLLTGIIILIMLFIQIFVEENKDYIKEKKK